MCFLFNMWTHLLFSKSKVFLYERYMNKVLNSLLLFIWRISAMISSHELKAQVIYYDHFLSGVYPFVCLSVSPSVNFIHFRLLIQNNRADFNQNVPKIFLGKEKLISVKMKDHAFFQREILKIYWQCVGILKNHSARKD